MIDIDVLCDTKVIFNYLRHSQAKNLIFCHIFPQWDLNIPLDMEIVFNTETQKVLKPYYDLLCAYIYCDRSCIIVLHKHI